MYLSAAVGSVSETADMASQAEAAHAERGRFCPVGSFLSPARLHARTPRRSNRTVLQIAGSGRDRLRPNKQTAQISHSWLRRGTVSATEHRCAVAPSVADWSAADGTYPLATQAGGRNIGAYRAPLHNGASQNLTHT